MPDSLREFIDRHARLFVLTGAGCSTDSGIPDYRGSNGEWKRAAPVMFRNFMTDPLTRARYWARSLVGWPHFHAAKPNVTHLALAALERRGRIELLATQNVDRLHHDAGSRDVVDLHGRLDWVRCMSCPQRLPREQLQLELRDLNPQWIELSAGAAPDGDADLDALDFSSFKVPSCAKCGGLLKPDVVFFGESVPPERVVRCLHGVRQADATLVIGSSLMVYSGYRFVQAARDAGKPIAAVNLGVTRADDSLSLKINQSCAEALSYLLEPQAA
jgi:NAD-dependent SIR2 family protein deacetylase